MKKVIVFLVGFSLLAPKLWALQPKWNQLSRQEVKVKSVLVDQEKAKVIYIGTERGIFKTEDGGAVWRNVFSLKGASRAINYLTFAAQDKKEVYAATAAGLFSSVNGDKSWKRLFKGKNLSENHCTAVVSLPQAIYLGTKSGLWVSKDKGRLWHKESGKLANSRIFNIAYFEREPNFLYVACTDGVFKSSDSGQTWERIYVAHPVENSTEPEEENEDRDEEARQSEIKYIAIDSNQTKHLYLATRQGIYWSKDRGSSWELFPGYGLLSQNIHFLLFSKKSELYAAAKSGVFVYKNETWRELSFRLSCRYINFIALDKKGNLYVCTEKGLFKSSLEYRDLPGSKDIIEEYTQGEPRIEEVQKEAIKYAEVAPEKISNWRKQAQKKAVLPHVSIGLERDSSDLWHWESGSTTRSNDDLLRRGRDSLDWDIRLSWDLSELIWNNDQTSIDTRSRLMVQLRNDLLDEVNKTYFERIRVKMELDSLQIEERKKRLEKELRLKELTASLDALTGGYFSSQIRAGG